MSCIASSAFLCLYDYHQSLYIIFIIYFLKNFPHKITILNLIQFIIQSRVAFCK